jgi:LysM repeat protein
MNQRFSVTARALAATALVAGFFVLAVVVAVSLDGGESSGLNGLPPAGNVAHRKGSHGKPEPPRFYTIQSGDTLTAIAHRMGVPLARIESLNPGVDPQILISGEKLKLR